VRRQKRFQSALEKFQRFTGSLRAGTLNLGGVMREGRCCDRGNFPRTRLSGSRLSWPKLAKARSGLVPTFQRREKKLAVCLGCTTVQSCWMLPSFAKQRDFSNVIVLGNSSCFSSLSYSFYLRFSDASGRRFVGSILLLFFLQVACCSLCSDAPAFLISNSYACASEQ